MPGHTFFITLLNYPLFYTLTKTHIFCLSEMHIHNSIPAQLFEIPGYTFINKNKDAGTHGGVAVYIKDSIPFIRRTDLEINELKCIWLEINLPNTKSFLISVWYRPPVYNNNSIIKVLSENKEMILSGELNIN